MNSFIISMIGAGSIPTANACSAYPIVCFSPKLKEIRSYMIKTIKNDFERLLGECPQLENVYEYKVALYTPQSNKWFNFKFKGIELMKKGILK